MCEIGVHFIWNPSEMDDFHLFARCESAVVRYNESLSVLHVLSFNEHR